ncbi:hypothetical protein ABTN31_19480, partial [Acinetobacter baumannii]
MRPPMALLTKILSDPEEALVRLRILTSFLYGFILMSRAGAFRQEGDLSVVTKRALELIVPEGNEL